MKKHIALAAAVTAAALLFCAVVSRVNGAERSAALRLHVIANSDSDEDQRIKLLVRDAVLECMADCGEADTPGEARELMLACGARLQGAAEAVLAREGADYGAELISGRFDFPRRDYGGRSYPAGEYEALKVVLGEGAGQNWWCVMFPPLCLINEGGVEKNEDGTLKFKSFFQELWERIFG